MSNHPAIFFSPHQDDETMAMGASIEEHAKAGRQIIVVLVTDGQSSGARGNMCDMGAVCLSVEQFVQARTAEFVAAVHNLAPNATIEYEHKVDGALTQWQANAIIAKYYSQYPLASFKTTSWTDNHRDHSRMGIALKSATQIEDARFYISPENDNPPNHMTTVGGPAQQQAIKEYSKLDTPNHRYGIGHIFSARSSFAYLMKHPESKIHKR